MVAACEVDHIVVVWVSSFARFGPPIPLRCELARNGLSWLRSGKDYEFAGGFPRLHVGVGL